MSRSQVHIYLSILMLGLLSLNGCVNFQELEFRGLSNLNVSRENGKMLFNIGLKAYNPNKFRISLTEHDIEVFIDDNNLGRSFGNDNYVLRANEEKELFFVVESDMQQIMGGFLSLLPSLFSKDAKVNVRLKGSVKGKAKGFSKRVKVDYTTKTSLNRN